MAGDFLAELPEGAEGYLLSSVLHEWGDDDARAILRNCASAAGEDGAVFVIEPVPDGTAPDGTATASASLDGSSAEVAASDGLAAGGSVSGSAAPDGAAVRGAASDGAALGAAVVGGPVAGSAADGVPSDGANSGGPVASSAADGVPSGGAKPGGAGSGAAVDGAFVSPAGVGTRARVGRLPSSPDRGVAELSALAESAGLVVAAVHTAGAVAIVELGAR